jgi:hypothetical protein
MALLQSVHPGFPPPHHQGLGSRLKIQDLWHWGFVLATVDDKTSHSEPKQKGNLRYLEALGGKNQW